MQEGDFFQRIVVPTSVALITMLSSRLVYFNASSSVATISGVLLFLSIGFGTLLIYPVSFFRGAPLLERVTGCLLTPLVWNGIEIYNASEAFTLAESLFYGLNILFLGTLAGQLLMMGVCDFLCRGWLRRRTGGDGRVVSSFSIFACVAGIVGLYFVLLWQGGAGLLYLYVDIYKALFV